MPEATALRFIGGRGPPGTGGNGSNPGKPCLCGGVGGNGPGPAKSCLCSGTGGAGGDMPKATGNLEGNWGIGRFMVNFSLIQIDQVFTFTQ